MKEYDKKVNLIDMLKNTIKSERKPCGYLEFYCHPSSHNVRTNLFIVRSIEALNQGMADTLEVGLKTVAIGRIYLKNPNPSA